jgi:hypothetical protein
VTGFEDEADCYLRLALQAFKELPVDNAEQETLVAEGEALVEQAQAKLPAWVAAGPPPVCECGEPVLPGTNYCDEHGPPPNWYFPLTEDHDGTGT